MSFGTHTIAKSRLRGEKVRRIALLKGETRVTAARNPTVREKMP